MGLHCRFLLLTDAWLAEGALGVWLIPSEFMDVGYGRAVKQYLTEQVTLLHVHRFCPTDAQFADALVSSAVVVYRKGRPELGHAVRFTFSGSLLAPQHSEVVPLSHLDTARNWTRYAAAATPADAPHVSCENVPSVPLAGLFAIKRDIATEANGSFILPRIPIVINADVTITLSPGGQNVLVKQIITDYVPHFTPGAALLYVGDTLDSRADIRDYVPDAQGHDRLPTGDLVGNRSVGSRSAHAPDPLQRRTLFGAILTGLSRC